MIIGVGFSREDLGRIASAVGTMSIALMKDASEAKDIIEALELAKLHDKLVKAIAVGDNTFGVDDDDAKKTTCKNKS